MTKTVLIIEDDQDIAESLRISLENESVRTRVSLTGEDGLSASLDKNSPPAAILLDLLLPGMNGIEICRRLRSEANTRNTPIIIITAKTAASDVLGCFDAGADDYITKPFSIRAVISRVQTLIARKQKKYGIVYDDGDLRIDFDQKLAFRNSLSLPLSGFDFALLSELVANAGRVTTPQQLTIKLWDEIDRVPHWAVDITERRVNLLITLCGEAIETVSQNSYRFVGSQFHFESNGNLSTQN